MKKSLLILFCLSMSYFLTAQETVKHKEIGIVFENFDNFGFTYKTGTEKALWRFTSLYLSGYNQEYDTPVDSVTYKYGKMGFQIAAGREYRKKITDNLEFRYGADLSFAYTFLKSDYDYSSTDDTDELYKRVIYAPGINLVLGLNYTIGNNLIIGAEILPAFTYRTGKETNVYTYISGEEEEEITNISSFTYGLSSSSVSLSFSYKF